MAHTPQTYTLPDGQVVDLQWVRPVTHAVPPSGSGLMPCCGRSPFDVPRTDRLTSTEDVTCRPPEDHQALGTPASPVP